MGMIKCPASAVRREPIFESSRKCDLRGGLAGELALAASYATNLVQIRSGHLTNPS